jgi:quercetin dioxygenase-like cupin family protein
MIEKLYKYALDDKNIVEKVVDTKNISIAHAIVEKGERFPTHNSNALVKLIIIKGTLSLKLNDQDKCIYNKGNIIEIPNDTKMELSNDSDTSLEFFAIKAPSPTFNNIR